MPAEPQNALLIHNPRAGNGGRRRTLDEARRVLAAGGITTELAETGGPGHASELAAHAGAKGHGLVIVCGGDGTLNEAVNGLAAQEDRRRVPLGLLPGGTANVLAKELGIPWNLPRAAQKLLRCRPQEIALGLATPLAQPEKKRYFISVAGAGPDGMIVYSLDPALKARVGILAYWFEGIRQAVRYRFPKLRISSREQQLEATIIIVGRTRHYGGPFQITTGADLREDRFELVALTSQSGVRYFSYLPVLWFGDLRRSKGVHFWKSDTVLCEPAGKEPVYAQVDGEALARLPVEFRIVPRALTLLMPPREEQGAA